MAPPEGPGVQRWRGVGSIGIESGLAERVGTDHGGANQCGGDSDCDRRSAARTTIESEDRESLLDCSASNRK